MVAWTINDPKDMAATLRLGVHGIITDRPDLLRQVVAEHNLPLPPPIAGK